MLKLYNKLSEYGVVMSMRCDNRPHILYVELEKDDTRRCRAYTYDTVDNPEVLERMLLSFLGEFMFIYEQECIKRHRAMILRDHLKGEEVEYAGRNTYFK